MQRRRAVVEAELLALTGPPGGGPCLSLATCRTSTAAPLILDTDGDGLLDTSLVDDGVDLIFGTDLDADGIVDQILRLGPDGVIHMEMLDDLT